MKRACFCIFAWKNAISDEAMNSANGMSTIASRPTPRNRGALSKMVALITAALLPVYFRAKSAVRQTKMEPHAAPKKRAANSVGPNN